MKVDVVIATYNRGDQVGQTIKNVLSQGQIVNKIYVINNASTDNSIQVLSRFEDPRLMVIHNEQNIGAARGKNVGLRMSDAEVIIVLDDDAVFCNDEPISKVIKAFEKFPNLGILQFKIINYQTKQVLKYEFPGDDPRNQANMRFNIGYFIGAGHALRKETLEKVGYYPDDYGLYAHEEVDLSYRAVNYGYQLMYEPSVAVYHMKAPDGRLPRKDVISQLLLNRLIMNRKYLPAYYKAINTFLWLMKTLIDARSPQPVLRAIIKYLRHRHNIQRNLLSQEAIRYLLRNNGRLYR